MPFCETYNNMNPKVSSKWEIDLIRSNQENGNPKTKMNSLRKGRKEVKTLFHQSYNQESQNPKLGCFQEANCGSTQKHTSSANDAFNRMKNASNTKPDTTYTITNPKIRFSRETKKTPIQNLRQPMARNQTTLPRLLRNEKVSLDSSSSECTCNLTRIRPEMTVVWRHKCFWIFAVLWLSERFQASGWLSHEDWLVR